jgi:hypothetical protein
VNVTVKKVVETGLAQVQRAILTRALHLPAHLALLTGVIALTVATLTSVIAFITFRSK